MNENVPSAENIRKTTYFETLAHYLKAYIGAGLFVMGDGFKNSGLLIGSVGTALIGLICIYNNHILIKISRFIKEYRNLESFPAFPETISYAFEMGPPSFVKLHRVVLYTIKACIYTSQYVFCVVYIVFVADTLKQILEEYEVLDELNKRFYILMTFPVVLALALIQNLKFLAPVSALSVTCLLYGFLGTLVLCCIDLPHISERRLVSSVSAWPNFIGTVFFAFEGIAVIIPLLDEMKKPNSLDSSFGVINIGMTIVLASYCVLGFFSFWKYGDEITGSVTLNLPHAWYSESIKVAVGMGILLAYPLEFYIPTKIMFDDISKRWGGIKHRQTIELLLRFAFVVITYILAAVLPYVDVIVSLIGVFACNMLAFTFPPLADICLRFQPDSKEDDKESQRKAKFPRTFIRLFLDAFTLAVFVVGFIFGMYTSVLNTIKISESY